MFISIVICTYRRAEDLIRLLNCLGEQDYPGFETLIVDGSGEDGTVRRAVARLAGGLEARIRLRLLSSPPGLTRQRNVGLREVRGDVVCFLDDDVTVAPNFLTRAASLLRRPDNQDVGGLTGYDLRNYPRVLDWHWRLRWLLGILPSLTPGDTDHLGRYVLHGLGVPPSGERTVRWLPGFCMLYRRSTIADLWFDEVLPTYGGEDKDFSMEVARRARLLFSGELQLRHYTSPQARARHADRAYQFGFGVGRSFAKRIARRTDYLTMARYTAGEFVDHLLSFAKYPSRDSLLTAVNIPRGILAGYGSWHSRDRTDDSDAQIKSGS